jgi:hypothetical protein
MPSAGVRIDIGSIAFDKRLGLYYSVSVIFGGHPWTTKAFSNW